ncbi:hypothetical protein [Veillonella sp. 3913]|uniref:hypothetical protein n=1 Tax=Veillonella sp. 3913 TaxID=2490952 RepID=UPI000F8CFFA5|nr:hypothetical protein [Veillonella sp. 3913]
MNTIEIFKKQIQDMMNTDYRSFVEALVSIEIGETNKDELRALYDSYMETDNVILLNEFFYE